MKECEFDAVLQEDLELSAAWLSRFEPLRDASVLITGATGLLGSQLFRTLACYNRQYGAGLQLILLVRSREKAESLFGELANRVDVRIVTGDIAEPWTDRFPAALSADYILHTAGVTASKTMVERPVETIETALLGTMRMLELARVKQCRGMVYVSSMEVYGVVNSDAPVTEEQLGYLDVLKVRSNYPESKRMCENLCVAYASEYALPVRIARLAQTFGAGVLPRENRVFAQFARSALRGEDIVLHTKGLSEGNYCYTRDTVRGILTILLRGEDGQAYNVANEASHTTIAGMAKMVAEEIAGGAIALRYEIPEENIYGYAPDTHLKLSSARLRALGWQPEVSLKDAYLRMMASMKNTGIG